ncbi:hypothetical protein N9K16_05680 [Alphaproteobacteria bacterium]|nr:hypothetical protein [Alphaproteobacteria bacterium]
MTYFLALFISISVLTNSPQAEAGLFSSLTKVASKAGKAGKVAGAGKGILSAGGLSKLKTVGAAAVLLEVAPGGGGLRYVDELGKAIKFGDAPSVSKLADEFNIPKGKPVEVFADIDTIATGHPDVLNIAKSDSLFLVGKNNTKLPVSVSRNNKLVVEFADGVKVAASDAKLFQEAAVHLNRAPNLANVRQIALSNDAKITDLPQVAFRQDGLPVVGGMSPDGIETAFSIIKGQSALLSGKIEDGFLIYKTGLTKTGRVSLDRLKKAASDANVDLTIIDSGSTRQAKIGSASKISAKLAKARTNADVYSTLTPKGQELVINASQDIRGRVQIAAIAIRPNKADELASTVAEESTSLAADVADYALMRAAVHGARAIHVYSNDEDRTVELANRFIPGIPSWIQYLAIANLALGLFSSISGWRFWRRVWPTPQSWLLKILRAILYVVPYLLLFGTIQMGVSYVWGIMKLVFAIIYWPIRLIGKIMSLVISLFRKPA